MELRFGDLIRATISVAAYDKEVPAISNTDSIDSRDKENKPNLNILTEYGHILISNWYKWKSILIQIEIFNRKLITNDEIQRKSVQRTSFQKTIHTK